jgi:aminoglycoside phosphotransferase (APT) family kinase protein
VEPELRRRVEERLGLEASTVERVEEGWDSTVFEVNGEWIVRVPRRDEVRAWMRKEASLLPVLAPALPVPVPRFEAVEDTDAVSFVAYARLSGQPLAATACRGGRGAALAAQLGEFLAALHTFPREQATRAGIAEADAADWLEQQRELLERCEAEAMPLLAESERRRARAVFGDFLSGWDSSLEPALVHADLGPAHILHRGSSISGVIDWSDARLGDPALDFAWLLHGTRESFGEALVGAYCGSLAVDSALSARALFYHRLGPWHEVLSGLDHDCPELTASGVAGIRERLPA